VVEDGVVNVFLLNYSNYSCYSYNLLIDRQCCTLVAIVHNIVTSYTSPHSLANPLYQLKPVVKTTLQDDVTRVMTSHTVTSPAVIEIIGTFMAERIQFGRTPSQDWYTASSHTSSVNSVPGCRHCPTRTQTNWKRHRRSQHRRRRVELLGH